MIKQNEGKYLLNKVNCVQSFKNIESMFGPFNQDELDYYSKHLSDEETKSPIHDFQKSLVFYPFYKYFGDTISIKDINSEMYIKLIVAGKRILANEGLLLMSEIFSGKINKFVGRKSVNKTLMQKFLNSSYYKDIIEKYHNDKIVKELVSMLATIISSDITIVSYENPEITGTPIPINYDILCEELYVFALLI